MLQTPVGRADRANSDVTTTTRAPRTGFPPASLTRPATTMSGFEGFSRAGAVAVGLEDLGEDRGYQGRNAEVRRADPGDERETRSTVNHG